LLQAVKKVDIFYCRSIEKYQPWYSKQPRGKHYLNEMVKKMCVEAKIEGDFTNHSLRASGTTELFQHEVPEMVIQDFTGHRSVKALRKYKVAVMQKRAASNILTATSVAENFSAEVQKVHAESKGLMSQQSSHMPLTAQGAVPKFSFPMPVFSPVINSQGIVNFTVNICPPGNITAGSTTESEKTYCNDN